ncbi:hypothetical protein [Metabacillus fastidiosus]|uniref:Uncharacterized protein n=1 Tax=Metabacillus fastidiosus TaxID=1458 RepID=A0ABU6NYV5_9BACI|nr:hypothetical protein [Metabacillus fastidiosus]MED4402285.1 hypothetical protein [Metabacillus fastidiosus]MED4454937.1 hypothetical protein [Metabacillus fastidiosus]MED4462156.1 hypothetical protein [Metabacillus fastidiosus]
MVTLIKNKHLKLNKEDNKKILEELQLDNSSNINPDYKAFLNDCIKVAANANKIKRVF